MTTIVAPVNFTTNSSNAARYAVDMALAIKAELHLIHVLQMPITVAEFPLTDYVFEEMHSAASQSLKQLWDELVLHTNGKVNIFIHLEIGNVEYKLEEFCRQKRSFFVIMGASGNTAPAIRHLPYPLIIVPENGVFHAIKKIVVACDLDDMASGAPISLDLLKELKTIFGASFDVINVNTRKEQLTAETIFEADSWKTRLQELFPEVHFVHTDKVEEGINQYLSGCKADLLMVFPKKYSLLEFHKSVTKKIAFNCTLPVMSIHA